MLKISKKISKKHFVFFFILVVGVQIFSGKAFAACSNPTGAAGEQMYNSTHNVMQFCDGTHWTAMKGDGTGGVETDPQVSSVTNGRICKGDGSAVTCSLIMPSCTGANKALQWDGAAFTCTTIN